MGVIEQKQARKKWKDAGRGQVWRWATEYAIHRKANSAQASKYLKQHVPGQLWYQVQRVSQELYGV